MQFFKKCVNSLIYIKCGIFNNIPHLLDQYFIYDKAIIIIDTNVYNKYKTHVVQVLNSLKFPYLIKCDAGEKAKSFSYIYSLIEQIAANKFTKNSLIIAIGGGTIGDMVGFIASILNRGLNFIQIPTTLMAQIDSSIGGKNAINLDIIKNKIGTIYFPKLIIIDPLFLQTLSQKELNSGLVEAIKHALISNFGLLTLINKIHNKIKKNDISFLENFVKKASLVKIKIVNKDPFEKLGLRYVLNLGHSFGHAIESMFFVKQKTITHGEAVAVGISLAYKFAYKFNYLLDLQDFIQVTKTFNELGINFNLNKVCTLPEEAQIISNYMQYDKKNSQDISLILPIDKNKFAFFNNVSRNKIEDFLKSEILA